MRASPMKGGETATIKRMVKDVQSTVACSIHERLKHGVIHYTTSKSLRSQLPLSVFLNRRIHDYGKELGMPDGVSSLGRAHTSTTSMYLLELITYLFMLN
ncbi:unnamed protein product [Brassica rapa subsp. trilocularis]